MEAEERCPICLEDFATGRGRTLREAGDVFSPSCCRQPFCGRCIVTHLQKRRECPLCRQPIRVLQSSRAAEEAPQRATPPPPVAGGGRRAAVDTLATVAVEVRCGRQRYHGVSVRRDSSLEELRRRLSTLFVIQLDRLTIIHKGKVLDLHSYEPAWLAGPGRVQLQLLGEPAPLRDDDDDDDSDDDDAVAAAAGCSSVSTCVLA